MKDTDTKRPMSSGQAQWKKQWIAVFLEAGIEREVAENAFEVYYGNQEINIFTDPIGEAKALCGVDVAKGTW
jgi:hypothetical protein